MAGESSSQHWLFHSSLGFDAVCLIALLADLPLYTSRHVDDAALWQERFRAHAGREARDAVGVLRHEVAEIAGKPLPAYLALWVSPAVTHTTNGDARLEQVIDALNEPELLVRSMRATSDHWSETDERLFLSICPALQVVLSALASIELVAWWSEHVAPSLHARCDELRDQLAPYDLVPLVERHTHIALPERAVEVCVLRWAAPHAIRVTGVRFLADVRYGEQVIFNNALHELLHPPWSAHHRVKKLLGELSVDPFLAQRFAARDPAAGYNTWATYAEEDAAQALDQLLATRLGRPATDPVSRWTAADGGMHVLALLLFDALVRGGFDGEHESYADYLARALTDGDPWPVDIRQRYAELTS